MSAETPIPSAPAPEPSSPPPAALPSAPAGDSAPSQPAGDSTQAAGDETRTSSIRPIPPRQRDPDTGQFAKERDLSKAVTGFKVRKDRSMDAEVDLNFPKPTRQGQAPDAPAAEAKPGEKAPELPKPEQAQAEPPRPKYKVADLEFESEAQAAQAFKTFRGAAQRLHQVEQKSWGWYQYAKQLEAKSQPGGQTQASQTAASPSPAGEKWSPISEETMGVYNELVQSHGPAIAAAWLSQKTAESVDARVQAQISAAISPIQQRFESQAQEQQTVQALSGVYEWAASQPDIFPGIGTPEVDRSLGQTMDALSKMGLDVTSSPDAGRMGIYLASLMYRDALAHKPADPTQPASPQVPPGPNPAAAHIAAQLLAQPPSADAISGPNARPTQPGRPLTRDEAFRQSLAQAPKADPELGFVRRRNGRTV